MEPQLSPQKRKHRPDRSKITVALIYARYLLPSLIGPVLLVMSLFYSVYFYMNGTRYVMQLSHFYTDTLRATRAYMSGNSHGAEAFYGWLAGGALLGLLLFLLGLFFTLFAAVTAVRAFRAGHESATADRMKLLFKIAFPNRVCLFLSDCLFVLAALYPQYYAFVSGKFLQLEGVAPMFGICNIPLFVTLGLTVLTLVLALCTAREERRRHMNMFLLAHPIEEKKPTL